MESIATTKMSSRRPPLRTWVLCFMEIADKACTKAAQLNGPIGSMTKKIARIVSFAFPFVSAFEYQLLLIFSFLDDRIFFTIESMVEAIFPSSRYAFDKIDELVRIAEILPGKFDEAVNKFPEIIHQVPFLDWALFRAISCLNFFLSILMEWGSGDAKEKEILIDVNCKGSCQDSVVVREPDRRIEGTEEGDVPESGSSGADTRTAMKFSYKDALEKVIKGTYKDALEKGSIENIPKKSSTGKDAVAEEKQKNVEKEEDFVEKKNGKIRSNEEGTKRSGMKKLMIENQEKGAKEEAERSGAGKKVKEEGGDPKVVTTENEISNGDEILELFDSAWITSPRSTGRSSTLPRSVSYQW